MGTPEYNEWPEGYILVQKLGIRLPNYNKSNLKQYVYNANDDAIDFLDYIFQINPDKRPSCNDLLKHPYFTEVQRPGSYSYQGRTFKNIKNKNYNDMYFNSKSNNFYATSNVNNDIISGSTSPSNERNRNERDVFHRTDSVMNGFDTNNYTRDKVSNFFKLNTNKNERNRENNYANINSFRNQYRNSNNQNDNQNEISKNSYNYYKNFNFSNYVNNNGVLPDIDTVFRKNLIKLQNNNAYSKYNDKDNENPLLNSFTQHNNKFQSVAKNYIMQDLKRGKYYSVEKNKRVMDDINSRMNESPFNNISPFQRERRKNNFFESGTKLLFPNIYNYNQIY